MEKHSKRNKNIKLSIGTECPIIYTRRVIFIARTICKPAWSHIDTIYIATIFHSFFNVFTLHSSLTQHKYSKVYLQQFRNGAAEINCSVKMTLHPPGKVLAIPRNSHRHLAQFEREYITTICDRPINSIVVAMTRILSCSFIQNSVGSEA